jgi:hypothetical protein
VEVEKKKAPESLGARDVWDLAFVGFPLTTLPGTGKRGVWCPFAAMRTAALPWPVAAVAPASAQFLAVPQGARPKGFCA